MTQNNLKPIIAQLIPQKRRGVAEVISTLLLVVITVVGAVILTQFIDESFVSGSLAVTSGTDTTIKSIKLRAFDTRDGDNLFGYNSLDNEHIANNKLCRVGCTLFPDRNPAGGGSDFIVIQFENRSVNPIYLKNVFLDNVNHLWDPATENVDLDGSVSPLAGGVYPSDGMFSILSDDGDPTQLDHQIEGGVTVNVVIKLDTIEDDYELSKTTRVQLNIGEASLADFLIETGGAQG